MLNLLDEMETENVLVLLDVIIDIKKQFELAPDNIKIPLFQPIIKFKQLYPIEGINIRDIYCERRFKAVEFFKRKEIIKNFNYTPNKGWDTDLYIEIDNEKIFIDSYKSLQEEYSKRINKEFEANKVIESLWDLIHPEIKIVSRQLYDDGHYSNSVESSLKKLDNVVKEKYKFITGEELAGKSLMNKAFSFNKPIIKLSNMQNDTDRNIQEGYMHLFAGAMQGIRNPNAHNFLDIDNEEAIHQLFLISHLMFMLDKSKSFNSQE